MLIVVLVYSRYEAPPVRRKEIWEHGGCQRQNFYCFYVETFFAFSGVYEDVYTCDVRRGRRGSRFMSPGGNCGGNREVHKDIFMARLLASQKTCKMFCWFNVYV